MIKYVKIENWNKEKNMVDEQKNPLAENLLGREINNKWKVIKKLEKSSDETGGMFSVGYEVIDNNKNIGFLKAFNFKEVFKHKDENMMQILNIFSEAYNYEKEILEKCSQKKLKHIVNILDAGTITENGYMIPVPYLIFEMAERSLRNKLAEIDKKMDVIWNLNCIHQIAVALQEIHNSDIAHLDLKPSNILLFDEDFSKLTDFGRSSMKSSNIKVYYEKNGSVEGDRSYAPIERLYGYNEGNWYNIKIGTDFYLLGSFIFQIFTGFSITTAIMENIDKQFYWFNWHGEYAEVYSYIFEAYILVMQKFQLILKEQMDNNTASEIVKLVNEMCTPDINRRGDPEAIKRKSERKYELYRYITRIDKMCKKLEISLKRGV